MDSAESAEATTTCLCEAESALLGCKTPKGLAQALQVEEAKRAFGQEPEEDACVLLDLCRDLANARTHCLFEKEEASARVAYCQQYLRDLHKLLEAEDGSGEGEESPASRLICEFQWTSLITATRGPKTFVLTELLQEIRMAAAFLALSLREAALSQLEGARAKGAADPDGLREACKEVVHTLREASGVLLASEAYFVKKEATQKCSVPSELLPSMCRSLSHICLGEAQLVTAYRAQLKGLSKPLVGSLYAGAEAFFEAAASEIKRHPNE